VSFRNGPKVLYVGGSGRSGSTLLSRLLGELPGFFAAGEVRYLWREGLGEDRLCGCGDRFSSCEFWSAVGDQAFGGWDKIDAGEMAQLEASVSRQRHIPLLMAPRISGDFAGRLQRFQGILQSLYAAIGKVADARVVVDSSKDPAYAMTLWRAFGSQLTVAHLVRDSRAVAFSWGRQTLSLDRPGTDATMHRFGPAQVGLRWTAYNAAMEALRMMHVPYVRLRYEDLVSDPRTEIRRVHTSVIGAVGSGDLAFLDEGEATMGVHHTLAGNPMRFGKGPVQLRSDDRWKTQTDAKDRLVVTALTWPLLRRYGFDSVTQVKHVDR
jgi:Sulfotransferase family